MPKPIQKDKLLNENISPSIDPDEIDKFSKIAEEWWDPNGKFKPLHKFNPTRISYIKEKLCEFFKNDINSNKPLKGLNILDIGCGGGLLSVPMARLGASVTAIDASDKNIKTAKAYIEGENIDINFLHISAEELAKKMEKFDVVLNMEVIEHVADVNSFMKASSDLLKPSGLMIVATLNRTAKSFAFGIVGAEYILGWLPKGTHQWSKFLKPSEIKNLFEENKIKHLESSGVKYNPLKDSFSLSQDLSVNFMMIGKKN